MNDTPKRIFLGSFAAGVNHLIIPSEALRSAEAEIAKANAERAERERAARETIVVDRAWLLEVLRDLIRRIERDKTLAARRGDRYQSAVLHYEAHRVREGFDAAIKRGEGKEPPT